MDLFYKSLPEICIIIVKTLITLALLKFTFFSFVALVNLLRRGIKMADVFNYLLEQIINFFPNLNHSFIE